MFGSAADRPSLTSSIATHLRDPMRRSAYALILATGLTSGLGLVFWALAARWLPAATVGIGAALVAAMALLANLSTLGLRNGLIRFLPTAGATSRRLILTCYALCAGTAMVAAGLFLLGQPLWADRLDFLRSSPLAVLAFVVGTACWVVFVLQDHVLVGLRLAVWVPLENALCAVAKIALLPALALTGGWAVFGASALPAAAAVVVVTTLILRHLRRIAPTETGALGSAAQSVPATRVPVSQLVRFAAADHVAALLWMATADLLTLLVLNVRGPEASAYYFMASTIGYTLALVISNVGSALVAEGARDPERAVDLSRQALWNSARLVVPLAVVGVLIAPFVLRILGPDYAANGTVLLQLLLIAAVPQLITGVAVSTARIRRDLRTIVAVYAVLAVGSIGGSWLLLDSLGLVGVGLSCLVSQTVVCLALLITGRTGLFAERGVRSVVAQLDRLPLRLRRLRSRQQTKHQLGPALAACGLDQVGTAFTPMTSDSDTLVVAVENDHEPLVLKIATSAAASHGLELHARTVTKLRDRLGESSELSDLLPRVVREGVLDGNRVYVETRLPGRSARGRLPEPGVAAAAFAALTGIHRATSVIHTVDDALFARWVDEPLSYLRGLRGLPGDADGLDRLRELLHESLLGRQITTAYVHGDFWGGNVMLDPASVRVTGLVDWENGGDDGLPDADLMHWWLASQPTELGTAVLSALADPAETRRELAELTSQLPDRDLPNPDLPIESVVLLTWLWHVTAGMSRTEADHLGRVWLARNVKPILQLLAGDTPVGPVSTTTL